MRDPTWCPGCGNFGIWQALQKALSKLNLKPEKVVGVFDIGCNSNMFNWLEITSLEGLHGRTLPVAQGIKMINPDLTVLAIAGDGGCYGEGGNHLLHAARRNPDLTLLVHNNQVYALTTGQTSPSSNKGFKTKSAPEGNPDSTLNPILLSLAAGASFVARGFSGDMLFLTDLIVQAVDHRGFSIVDILQPCVTFNSLNTFAWFKERIYQLDSHDPSDKKAAFTKALEWPTNEPDGKIPTGVFYKENREPQALIMTKKDKETTAFSQSLIQEFL